MNPNEDIIRIAIQFSEACRLGNTSDALVLASRVGVHSLSSGITKAVSGGHTELTQQLIEIVNTHPKIIQRDKDDAVRDMLMNAVAHGYDHVVLEWVKNHPLSLSHIESLLMAATLAGSLEVFDAILVHPSTKDCNPELEGFLKSLANRSDIDMIKVLCPHLPNQEKALSLIQSVALEQNDKQLYMWAYEKEPVLYPHASLCTATSYNSFEVAKYLCQFCSAQDILSAYEGRMYALEDVWNDLSSTQQSELRGHLDPHEIINCPLLNAEHQKHELLQHAHSSLARVRVM